MKCKKTFCSTSLILALYSSLCSSQETHEAEDFLDGQAQYQLFCAECHEGALLEAPRRAAFELYPPKRIVDSLEYGVMATSGMALTRKQKRNVAYFLTGKQFNENRTELSLIHI